MLAVAILIVCGKKQQPPPTRMDNVVETIHGTEVVDPYRWLENQDSSDTRAWIDAQNAYAHSLIDKLPGREKLEQRLTELLKIDRISIPMERNGRYFLSKRSADQEQWIIYMRDGLDGEDKILIDPHPMSADHTTSVNLIDVSKDGTLMAYGIQEGGQDESSVRLFNVDQKIDLPDQLPKALYFSVSIKPDKSGFYYSKHDNEKGGRIYYHAMGTDVTNDAKIFGDGYGPEKILFASLSEDGRYLLIHVLHGSTAETSELYYQDLKKAGKITPIVTGIDARFYGWIVENKLFLQTNWNAPNNKILLVDLNRPAQKDWQEIIPESESVMEGFSLAGGKLFVNYLENVVSKVKVFAADGAYIRDIAFPSLGSVGGVGGRWESNEAFFVYTSFHVPTTIYRYDVATGDQQIWAQLKVPVNTDIFDVKQVWYTSKDSTKVPMFLVHRKGLKLDGANPTLLTGYGGFNVSLTPYFSPTAVLWVEKGGVFAMPNLRGGGEFGEQWHKAGMLENKQNVFDDFIAAAEWLINNGYTSTEKLAISGGSNGGLLVGAALVQRPDLFQAVVCTYPLLDMVRYHNFMMAKFWVSEYGSSEDVEQFNYIFKYSPYHNVKPGTEYPAVLFITGDSDTRVAPLHARKMTALVQSATGSEHPVLLLYDTKAGHSGGMPVSKQIEDEANELQFLFWQLGMKM
jgi:prolyl oligopeptidase